MRKTAHRIPGTLFDFAVADAARYRLMNHRVIRPDHGDGLLAVQVSL